MFLWNHYLPLNDHVNVTLGVLKTGGTIDAETILLSVIYY